MGWGGVNVKTFQCETPSRWLDRIGEPLGFLMSECSACSDAVWNTQASNGYGTCGQQIAWVRTNIATQQTWEAACSYVALQASTPE